MTTYADVKDYLEHLSEKPWSDFTKADYSIEQWHTACLIHQHEGEPTSKNQCKLPIKTPSGTINRNGVHAAAAALAGARGGVHASVDEKAKACNALVRCYRQMDEEPPPYILNHSNLEEVVEHFGVKGQKWGVRKTSYSSPEATEAKALKKKPRSALTNAELKRLNERMNLERNYKSLNNKSAINTAKKGKAAAAGIMATLGLGVSAYNMFNSKAGQDAIKLGQSLTPRNRRRARHLPLQPFHLINV